MSHSIIAVMSRTTQVSLSLPGLLQVTLTVDQLEDVIVDKVLTSSSVSYELEGLAVVHRALLLVNLLQGEHVSYPMS